MTKGGGNVSLFQYLRKEALRLMKIYEVNGRLVWLNKAPEGYVEPVKEEPKAEPKAKPEPATKAKKAPANKARKAGSNK